ncbi:MAG: hypothetical protein PHQ28_06730 [Mycobacterium sp.]|nr:hypothetical protein [Mycobacterium sp.]
MVHISDADARAYGLYVEPVPLFVSDVMRRGVGVISVVPAAFAAGTTLVVIAASCPTLAVVSSLPAFLGRGTRARSSARRRLAGSPSG